MGRIWEIRLSLVLHASGIGMLVWASQADPTDASWAVLVAPVLFLFGALFGRRAMLNTRRHLAIGVIGVLIGAIGYLVTIGGLMVQGMFGINDPMGAMMAAYLTIASLAFAWGIAVMQQPIRY